MADEAKGASWFLQLAPYIGGATATALSGIWVWLARRSRTQKDMAEVALGSQQVTNAELWAYVRELKQEIKDLRAACEKDIQQKSKDLREKETAEALMRWKITDLERVAVRVADLESENDRLRARIVRLESFLEDHGMVPPPPD